MRSQGLVSKAISTVALAAVMLAPLLTPVSMAAKDKHPHIDPSKLAWPAPPEVARVKFVAEYHGEDIKGIKKQGILERLAGVEDATSKSIFMKPYGLAEDSKGRIYVSDTVSNIVFVLDVEKKNLSLRGDKPPATFKKPMGMVVDSQDRLFVADAITKNISVFTPNGELITLFGQEELTRPVGLAVDEALNRLYVADVKARKVAVYDLQSFKFLNWIGKSMDEKVDAADKDKILASPTALGVDPDGLLYVVDTFLNRVTVFDTDGEFVRYVGSIGQGPGKFMRPRGIGFDNDGHVYITDGMAHLFQILTPEGAALMPVGGIGENPGHFQVPADILVDKNNRIIVADQNNRRIQVFRYVTDAEAGAVKGKGAVVEAVTAEKKKK